jgi:hypothetical protein
MPGCTCLHDENEGDDSGLEYSDEEQGATEEEECDEDQGEYMHTLLRYISVQKSI